MFTIEEIKENLCINDKRNPDYNDLYRDEDDTGVSPENCSCDACFYGRHALAEALLIALKEKEDAYQEGLEDGFAQGIEVI